MSFIKLQISKLFKFLEGCRQGFMAVLFVYIIVRRISDYGKYELPEVKLFTHLYYKLFFN